MTQPILGRRASSAGAVHPCAGGLRQGAFDSFQHLLDLGLEGAEFAGVALLELQPLHVGSLGRQHTETDGYEERFFQGLGQSSFIGHGPKGIGHG